MAERGKSDLMPQRRSLKLSPAIGDWTTYKVPQQLVKRVKIGLYGFDRLSEEELNTAHLIHYRFAESWIKALRSGLGVAGELFSVEAQQMPYGNFVKSLNGPILQGKVTSPDQPEEIFLSADSSLAESIVAAALGGEAGGGRHQITEADQLVFDTAFSENLNLLNTAFSNIFKALKYETVSFPDPAPLLSVNHQTTFVVFSLELTLGEAHGKLLLGYTGPFLKGLLKKTKELTKPKPLPLNKLGPQILNNILVPVRALLGTAELKAGEIRGLETGDVVTVNNSIFNAINIFLGGKKVVQGQPGEQNGKLVLRVVGVEKEKEVKVEPPPVLGPPPPAPTKPVAPPAAKPLPAPPAFKPMRPVAPPPPPPKLEEEEEEEFLDEDLEEDLLDEEEFPEDELEEEEFGEEKEAS